MTIKEVNKEVAYYQRPAVLGNLTISSALLIVLAWLFPEMDKMTLSSFVVLAGAGVGWITNIIIRYSEVKK